MSVFGAVVMAHSPQNDALNSPSQFFSSSTTRGM